MGLLGRQGEAKIEIQWSRLLEGRMFEVTNWYSCSKWKYFSVQEFLTVLEWRSNFYVN